MQRFNSLVVLLGLCVNALDASAMPYYPNVTDPNFPLGSRCIDYCAFLNPGQICPGHPLDVNCLCEVYNQRLAPCEQCWANKNITVANNLLAIESLCSSYLTTTSISATPSTASASATTTGTIFVTLTTTASAFSSATSPPSLQSSGVSSSGTGFVGLWVLEFVTIGIVVSLS